MYKGVEEIFNAFVFLTYPPALRLIASNNAVGNNRRSHQNN